jgi:hypothetical protein
MISDNEQFWKADDERNLACVTKALEDASIVNTPDESGDTPLVKAIRLTDPVQRLTQVQALLAQGADPDFRGEDGESGSILPRRDPRELSGSFSVPSGFPWQRMCRHFGIFAAQQILPC